MLFLGRIGKKVYVMLHVQHWRGIFQTCGKNSPILLCTDGTPFSMVSRISTRRGGVEGGVGVTGHPLTWQTQSGVGLGAGPTRRSPCEREEKGRRTKKNTRDTPKVKYDGKRDDEDGQRTNEGEEIPARPKLWKLGQTDTNAGSKPRDR